VPDKKQRYRGNPAKSKLKNKYKSKLIKQGKRAINGEVNGGMNGRL